MCVAHHVRLIEAPFGRDDEIPSHSHLGPFVVLERKINPTLRSSNLSPQRRSQAFEGGLNVINRGICCVDSILGSTCPFYLFSDLVGDSFRKGFRVYIRHTRYIR